MGAYQLGVVRERNNEMMMVVGAVEGADNDNICEIEQLRDSLTGHRI